ncbi:MAG: quinolinate synthase NadA [Spirochaetes bacterium]|nr:quinolinate synthase NadA [Spirochaetota bacterium]
MKALIEKIQKLKSQKDAVILVHNYQKKEIQDIADILGDSLDLSRKAKGTSNPMIIFCGVRFMAETAKILSPDKKVLLPVFDAGCPMADMVTANDILDYKKEHPDVFVVSYVNTSAEVKAVSDICCTSANAVQIVKNIKARKILFVPDKNLGDFVKRRVPEKEIQLWDGYCIVHVRINKEHLKKMKKEHPEALVLVHPECESQIIELADEVTSTNGMVKFVKDSEKTEFIIATEEGMIDRLKKEAPDKIFYPASKPTLCRNMKKTGLEDVLRSFTCEQYEINLPDPIIRNAQAALNRMLEYSK